MSVQYLIKYLLDDAVFFLSSNLHQFFCSEYMQFAQILLLTSFIIMHFMKKSADSESLQQDLHMYALTCSVSSQKKINVFSA